MNRLMFASVISEIQQSDIFMTVKARICEAPAANLNGARVTEAFIYEIIDNKEQYVGLPLYADVRALTNGNYRRLGHLYDSRTGEFHSTQIGSFYDFEREDFDNGCYLVGYARIAKRNKKLSKAISELFADGALKFSFEVNVGEYTELEDGTIQIDASDSNYLEGTAIVTFPACEEAVALQLVAQQKADDEEGGERDMADNKETLAEQVTEEPVTTEEPTVAEEPVVAETTQQEAETEPEENAEIAETEESAACKDEDEKTSETAEQQNAAVYVREEVKQEHSTYAHDTESGVDVYQHVEVETSVSHVEPEAQIVEADDGVHIAENGDGDGANSGESGASEEPASGSTDDPNQEDQGQTTPPGNTDEAPVTVDDSKKQTAEQLIAELAEQVEALRNEIAELKEAKAVAEVKTVTAEINPIMADIRSEGRFSLLEKDDKPTTYSLLSR